MTEYALFVDGKQTLKAHPHYRTAIIEAYEQGFVVSLGRDFPADSSGVCLVDGAEIKRVEQKARELDEN